MYFFVFTKKIFRIVFRMYLMIYHFVQIQKYILTRLTWKRNENKGSIIDRVCFLNIKAL